MGPLPRVCVIGAGSSGIAVVKALQDRGLPHTCFEKGDEIGGNWCFRNSNGMSAAYESLHINTDAKLMEYRDYPMPPGTPDYPSHRVIKAYFDDYADRFGLRENIRFGTEVTRARRRGDGAWEITLDAERAAMFRRYRDHSPRHTMQVDFEDYLHRLRKHARRGGQRARRLGQPLPVPARAGAAPG